MKSLLAVVLGLGLLMGCNTEKKAPEAFTVTPLPAPTPIGKGGIPDDSIKPVIKPVAKGGVPDDSVKPVPVPTNTIKVPVPMKAPAPVPTPTTKEGVSRGGVADDGV